MKKLVIIIAFLGLSPLTFAQYRERHSDRYPRKGYERNEDRREDIQSMQREIRRKIAFGIESGSITSRESKHLLREVEKNEQLEARYRRDGQLDVRERRDLIEDLERLSHWVKREKRDGDRVTYEEYNREYSSRHHENRRGRY